MTQASGGETREQVYARLISDLGSHYFWLPRLLARAGGWQWLVPWPLLALSRRRRQSKEHGSLWLSGVACIISVVGLEPLACLELGLAREVSRTLFTAAFLVMTMLSLSVALPGQAIIKLVLGKAPIFAAEFVAPTVWAFLWGVVAGIGMMCYPDLSPRFRAVAASLALYGFAMTLSATFFTIRVYVLGLVLMSREDATPSGDEST